MTRHVDVGGVRYQVPDDFNPDDATEMEALTALADYVTTHAPRPTPEQEAQHAEWRARIRARNERLRRGEKTDG